MTPEEIAYRADIHGELHREWNDGRYLLVIGKCVNIALIPLRVYSVHYARQFARWILKVTAEKRK